MALWCPYLCRELGRCCLRSRLGRSFCYVVILVKRLPMYEKYLLVEVVHHGTHAMMYILSAGPGLLTIDYQLGV